MGDSASAARPAGMLMKKIHRQPGPSTSGPPISHAAAAPMPPPQIPSALFRSDPSAKVVEMIESAVGVMIAAPAPWTTRAARSAAGDQASPHMSDAAVKNRTPAMNTRRHPSRSAARPPEQEQAAEGEGIGAQHPWQILLREAQAA